MKDLKQTRIIGIVIGIIMILGGIISSIYYITNFIEFKKFDKNACEQKAVITNYYTYASSSSDSLKEVLEIEYLVDNTLYNLSIRSGAAIYHILGDYMSYPKIGDSVTIKYNPENPIEISANVLPSKGAIIFGMISIIGGISFIIASKIGYSKSIKKV